MKADKPLKIWPNENGVVISHAFTSDGEHYYYVKDVFSTFAHRAMEALAVYDKWGMRCTREYLLDWMKAMDEVTTKTINFHEFYKLIDELKERIHFAVPTEDVIWEFAGVVFFDEYESPYKYDNEYAKEKIVKWKAAGDVADFFFKTPIKELIPFPDLSENDLRDYLQLIQKANKDQIEHIYSIILQHQQNQGSYTAQSLQENMQGT